MRSLATRHSPLATALLVCPFAMAVPVSAGEWGFRRHAIDADGAYSACGVLDVNRDGKPDIVCGGWWFEAPDWKRHYLRDVEVIRGRFDDYSNLPLDVNGDGWPDLISANYRSQTLYWIEHPGAGPGEWKTHTIARPGPMETARLYDIDRDGRLDVLPNGVRFAAWWRLAEDASTDSPQWVRHDLPGEVAGHGVGFGDLDGDGRGDIVGPRGWLKAPEDVRRGRWTWRPEFQLHRDGSIPILVLDADGDGDNDLVWGRGHNVGLYWLEQRRDDASDDGVREWVWSAIDTSWSQPHSLLQADLDNDGRMEVIAGKRYMGHDGKDIGEYDPLVVYAYSFQPETKTWRRRLISYGGGVGFGLDPSLADLDGDEDVDLVGAGRSGLYWLENLYVNPSGVEPTLPGPAPEYDDHSQLLVFKDADGKLRPVTGPAEWAVRRSHILAGAQEAMGPLPGPERRVPLDVETLEETETSSYLRRKITFAAEPGDRVPAYLLIPKKLDRPAAAMLCLHQTTKIGKGEPAGLGGKPTLDYAHELAERGFVCLAPDYPSFGDYEYDFRAPGRLPSGTMKAIWNNLRAVDLLESMEEVDPDRIGAIGHSLGGHNAIFTAAFDQRIKAVVSSCGFTAFHHYYGGDLAGWTSDRYMPRIRGRYGADPDRVPFDFYELVAALAPRAFFTNSPTGDGNFDVAGVKKVIDKAGEVYDLLGAGQRLKAVYPETRHAFPDEQREQAYAWLEEQLNP